MIRRVRMKVKKQDASLPCKILQTFLPKIEALVNYCAPVAQRTTSSHHRKLGAVLRSTTLNDSALFRM
jgi:hypothetical protein